VLNLVYIVCDGSSLNPEFLIASSAYLLNTIWQLTRHVFHAYVVVSCIL